MPSQLKKVAHNYLRYANCWEDADVLIKALNIEPDDEVLSIASAGDNTFSILAQAPKKVVAVDVNVAQLKLVELKKAAFEQLNYSEFLQFLGFTESESRLVFFEKVKLGLSKSAVQYWSSRRPQIQAGIIYQGKFEKYFNTFRKRVLPLIHSRKHIDKLFSSKGEKEQFAFYNKTWNSWRWRALFKFFFSEWLMGRLGRDPQFLKEVEVPVADFILEKSRVHLSSVLCQKNYFLHFILKGSFGNSLPHYARAENFDKIKNNIGRLELYEGFAESAMHKHKSISKFNLSNIFEYMPSLVFDEISAKLVLQSAPKAHFVYWNLMVPRRMSVNTTGLEQLPGLAQDLHRVDKGFFYGNLIIENKVQSKI